MKQQDITIGNVYDVKVGKNTTAVRITKCLAQGGWEGVTLSGNKTLTIKDAKRIVGLHHPKVDTPPAKPKTSPDTGEPVGKGAQQRAASVLKQMAVPLDDKRTSILDAAAKVLAEAKEPLNCKLMIKAMTEKGYWQPSHAGKTPANTLHAAISKEVKVKGTDSRFEKVARGQFALVTAR